MNERAQKSDWQYILLMLLLSCFVGSIVGSFLKATQLRELTPQLHLMILLEVVSVITTLLFIWATVNEGRIHRQTILYETRKEREDQREEARKNYKNILKAIKTELVEIDNIQVQYGWLKLPTIIWDNIEYTKALVNMDEEFKKEFSKLHCVVENKNDLLFRYDRARARKRLISIGGKSIIAIIEELAEEIDKHSEILINLLDSEINKM